MTKAQLIQHARDLGEAFGKGSVSRKLFINTAWMSEDEILRRVGTWNKLWGAAGLPREERGRYSEVTAEQLLELLRDLVRKHGPEVTMNQFIEETGYGLKVIASRWGLWSKLRKAAGLRPHAKLPPRYTEAQLLADLWKVYRKTGTPPNFNTHRVNGGQITVTTFAIRFGSWTKAKEAFEEYRKEREKRCGHDEKGDASRRS